MGRGEYHQIGEGGQWGSVTSAAALHSKLYTCDQDGYLYQLDPASGTYSKLSESSGWKSCVMQTHHRLFTREESGSLFSISPEDGTHIKVGESGQWKGALASEAARGKLYVCDGEGALHVVDPWTHKHRSFCEGTWAPRWLLDGGDYLVSLEESGTLYRIDLDDGAYEKIGDDGAWEAARAAAAHNGMLYICDQNGALHEVDIYDGDHGRLDEATWKSTSLIFGDYLLYSFEENGSLYQIALYD